MRIAALALALLGCSAAIACPADRRLVLIRETDGLEFVPTRFGRGVSGAKTWAVYDGRAGARRLYFATGRTPDSAALSTSGETPPSRDIRWEQTMPEPAAYGFTVAMQEGPLEGLWRPLCRPK